MSSRLGQVWSLAWTSTDQTIHPSPLQFLVLFFKDFGTSGSQDQPGSCLVQFSLCKLRFLQCLLPVHFLNEAVVLCQAMIPVETAHALYFVCFLASQVLLWAKLLAVLQPYPCQAPGQRCPARVLLTKQSSALCQGLSPEFTSWDAPRWCSSKHTSCSAKKNFSRVSSL